jgi:hypothetical protein
MIDDNVEYFLLPDGTKVATGYIPITEDARNHVMANVPAYPESMLLDDADIKKSLGDDKYKLFRKLRSGWTLNQAQLGKCNAAATVGGVHNIRGSSGHKHVVLSDCYLYMNINGGRDGGSALEDGFAFAEGGLAPRVLTAAGQTYTIPSNVYNKRQVLANWLSIAESQRHFFQTWEAYRLPCSDYNTFKRYTASALARDHQIVFAWHVGNSSMRLRNGYVVTGNGPGNHATLFHSAKYVGGDDIVHPDMQNSWGPSKDPMYGPVESQGWGDDGRGLFTMQDAYKCSHNHVFWVITGAKVTEKSL